jgi:hypothetical protein
MHLRSMAECDDGDAYVSLSCGPAALNVRASSCTSFFTDDGTSSFELMRFSAASTTPSEVWMPTAVVPSWRRGEGAAQREIHRGEEGGTHHRSACVHKQHTYAHSPGWCPRCSMRAYLDGLDGVLDLEESAHPGEPRAEAGPASIHGQHRASYSAHSKSHLRTGTAFVEKSTHARLAYRSVARSGEDRLLASSRVDAPHRWH